MKKALWLLFSLDGCVGRKTWWAFEICWVLFVVLLFKLGGDRPDPSTLVTTCVFLSLWPKLAVMVKRWHDRGKSGYWVFISLIPLVGPIWALIELGFLGPTDDYSNEYYHGNDPWAPIPKIVPKIVSPPNEG